jgi:hypothetical protein
MNIKVNNMTTIYETYTEQSEKLNTMLYINLNVSQTDIEKFLRQSFIAMVEGELKILKNQMGVAGNDYNDAIDAQISRLESELSRFKEN